MSTAPDPEPDVESDPARGGEGDTDWDDEGGATPEGPATDPEAG